MSDIQLDFEMKPETLKKLNRLLDRGALSLRGGVTKKGMKCYVLSTGEKEFRSLTVCSAIEGLHTQVFSNTDEITIDGVVYVKKATQ